MLKGHMYIYCTMYTINDHQRNRQGECWRILMGMHSIRSGEFPFFYKYDENFAKWEKENEN